MAGDNICAICDQPAHGFRACQSHVMTARIEKLKQRNKALSETVCWMAQTFHQGHHLDQTGTFKECPMNTCDAATQALATEEKS